MNRIDAQFARLKDLGQAAFIPFLTAGDPDLDGTCRVLHGAEQAGASLIELGFPFSDPVADGPTIQASYTRVLERGQRAAQVFDLVAAARQECALPIVAMISYSIVFRMGFEAFLDRALACGIDGATVPDLPVDEAELLYGLAQARDFRLVCFATPATTPERRRMVADHARGFIYYISVRGITGARSELPPDLVDHIAELKESTSVPVAVGFGISEPDQARAVARVADGVIVGSAIVKRMAAAAERGEDAAEAALGYIRTMSAATRDAR
jgi:tryptophan synthase alpha chain